LTAKGLPPARPTTDLLANASDIADVDVDGNGTIDFILPSANRPHPNFVGITAVLDPAELAQGRRVSVGTAELVTFGGEQFAVIHFANDFSGPVTLEYVIADSAGLQDTGFALATVADSY